MVSPQCAAAGVSSVDHSGQTPSHNLGSHTDKVSLLKGRGGGIPLFNSVVITQCCSYSNTKGTTFNTGTSFLYHRPGITVPLPVKHFAIASGLTGVYMTFPAS